MSNNIKEIRNDILREMYGEAEPPLDFDKVLNNEIDLEENWCKRHELEYNKQEEILQKHFDKNNLDKREKRSLRTECMLALGPAVKSIDEVRD